MILEKEFVVNRNSWHYKVNMFTVSSDNRYSFDYWLSRNATFCSYFWRTTWSILWVAVILSIFLAAFGLVSWVIFTNPVAIGKAILGALAVFVGSILLFLLIAAITSTPGWIKNYVGRKTYGKEPGFFGMKYHSFKNKYCPKLVFKE